MTTKNIIIVYMIDVYSQYVMYVTYLHSVAPYFKNCISETDLNELNIEIIRNTLYKVHEYVYIYLLMKWYTITFYVYTLYILFYPRRHILKIFTNSVRK